MKGKLVMSFYRATKPSSTPHQYNGKVVKPTTHPLASSIASVGYIVNQDKVAPQQKQTMFSSNNSTAASVGFIVNQEMVNPQPKQRVSFIMPDNGRDSYGMFDNPYGIAGDEGVDVKAASYISCVQERFRLERANSERKKSQDMTK
ncbi:hypothetical protein LguiA_016930 [Lonicera macranthoides]